MKRLLTLLTVWVLALSALPSVKGAFHQQEDDVALMLRKKRLGGAVQSLALSSGWTFIQDTISDCTGGSTTCTTPACTTTYNCIIPTTAGSVWVMVLANTTTNLTISGVSGGGGTWTACASSGCHQYLSGLGNIDVYYNLTGSSGSNSFTVTASTTIPSGGDSWIDFIELLPPSGYTASLDSVGTSTTCGGSAGGTGTTCTGAALTVTGTDALLQIDAEMENDYPTAFNAFSGSFLADYQANGICLNCTGGTAPAVTMAGST
jgi:hypothetical protein